MGRGRAHRPRTWRPSLRSLPARNGPPAAQVTSRDRARTPAAHPVLALALALGLLAGPVQPPSPAVAVTDACKGAPRHGFVDVPATHRSAVECVVWYRVLGGTTVDTFRPGAVTSRAGAAIVLHRALRRAGVERPSPSRRRFTDLTGHAYRNEIEQLAHAGIVTGLSDTVFDPGRRVTRARLALWTLRARIHVAGPPPRSPPDAYRDDDHPLEARINQAAALGLAPPRAHGLFSPTASATRGDLALFGAALVRRLGDEGALRRARSGSKPGSPPCPPHSGDV
jgi:hypothetical protein